MGATLSSRAEWTSASEKGGKLDFSKSNEALLLEILKYLENLCKERPRESTVVFKRPFVWTSTITLAQLEALKRGDEYLFRYIPASACNIYVKNFVYFFFQTYAAHYLEIILSDSGLVSAAKEENGDPHLSVSKVCKSSLFKFNNSLQCVIWCFKH